MKLWIFSIQLIIMRYFLIKIDTTTVNGAGCAFSSAITANLVLGADFTKAVAESKKFVAHCISNGVLMNDHTGSVWSGGIQKEE